MIKSNSNLIQITLPVAIVGVFVGLIFGYFMFGVSGFTIGASDHTDMNMTEMRDQFISLKGDIQSGNRAMGNYACCLEKPCVYCIEKTPGHGEGSICRCLDDVINGVHPCGECIGEILEGHGNVFLAPYFARAIAEKTGEYDAIKRIISEKYDIAFEKQY